MYWGPATGQWRGRNTLRAFYSIILGVAVQLSIS